ncbi:MAG: polysaccharide deacetylase family protein [Anaerotardibacter sp.]
MADYTQNNRSYYSKDQDNTNRAAGRQYERSTRNTLNEGMEKFSRNNASSYREQASAKRPSSYQADYPKSPRQRYEESRGAAAQNTAPLTGGIPRVNTGDSSYQNTTPLTGGIPRINVGEYQNTGSFGFVGATGSFERTSRIGNTGSFNATGSTGSFDRINNTGSFSRTGSFDRIGTTGSFDRTRAVNNTGSFPSQSTLSADLPPVNPEMFSQENYQNCQQNTQTQRGTRRNRGSQDGGSQNQSGRQGASRIPVQKEPSRKKPLAIILALLVVLVVGIGGFNAFMNSPVDVTLNGNSITLQGNQRTCDAIMEAGLVSSVKPGNKLAIDNTVFKEGEGEPYHATINGSDENFATTHINNGDVIEITNGKDLMEDYTDSAEESFTKEFYTEGTGAIHLYEGEDKPGTRVTRTGKESGITIETIKQEPEAKHLTFYNASTSEKIIALTFDDGPWPESTEQVLDVLKEYDVKATFFTIGSQIYGKEDIIKRMDSEGHQICTHSYDHAAGSGQGVSLNFMSTNERRDEILKGYQAIKDATGKEASTVIRAPGGNYDTNTAKDLSDIVTAEIGWNIDTEDWRKPGAEAIANRIMNAKSGSIVLMHDGGGNREQTVQALSIALPYLKEQGYTFVTIDELIARSSKA